MSMFESLYDYGWLNHAESNVRLMAALGHTRPCLAGTMTNMSHVHRGIPGM
jgi:hypothetical protein